MIFIAWIAFIPLQQKTNFNRIKEYLKINMSSGDTSILEFNQYQKSDKAPFIIYADLEYLIEKIDRCKTNPENSFTTKVGVHIPSVVSMSIISLFRSIEN